MTPYELAWVVVAAAAVLGTICLIFLTRNMANGWFRRTLRWLPLLLLVVPAAVPGYQGNYAPAFVVAVFEAFFQSNGNPWPALRLLLIAAGIGLILILIAGRIRRTPAASEPRTG